MEYGGQSDRSGPGTGMPGAYGSGPSGPASRAPDARSGRSYRSARSQGVASIRSERSRQSGASCPTERSHSRQQIEAFRAKESAGFVEGAPRKMREDASRTEAVYNLEQKPPVFSTSNGHYGIYEHEPRSKHDAQDEPSAGLSRGEAAYHYYGNCFPRFERQRIRYNFDKEILDGVKEPDPALMLPAMNVVINDSKSERSGRSRSSGFVSRDGNSVRSARSQSVRSAARSVVSSVRSRSTRSSTRWHTQHPGMPAYNPWRTHNNAYGMYLGAGEIPQPGDGREVWMKNRGGQQSSFDSCLILKKGGY